MGSKIIQRGFQKKKEVQPLIKKVYASPFIEWLRSHGNEMTVGKTRILLAKEFGFCYGVERAIQYAYETRLQFPDRRIFITGEIIHNPIVNERLHSMGIEFIPVKDGEKDYSVISPGDIIIIPAFGMPKEEFEMLKKIGCVLVDTTCGSVMNVWKSVRKHAESGFTSIIHGKWYHEETRATASQAYNHGGHFLIILNRKEAEYVAEFIRNPFDDRVFLEKFRNAHSPGFKPSVHLQKIGFANQTTMLMRESLEIQEILRKALIDRYGKDNLNEHLMAFETICSATQDRQDAVVHMLETETIDLMLVIGGFNSSNTGSLLRICIKYVPSYHINTADALLSPERIFHKPYGKEPTVSENWLPEGKVTIGITAGASTPDSEVESVIRRVLELRGEDLTGIENLLKSEAHSHMGR